VASSLNTILALYCSTTHYLHISTATNVTPATGWHACSLVQTKHPSHHHLNKCNHTENMEKSSSVICNLTFLAQKAPSPWQTNVTWNSIWSIRIHNMSQFPMKKFKDINTGKGKGKSFLEHSRSFRWISLTAVVIIRHSNWK